METAWRVQGAHSAFEELEGETQGGRGGRAVGGASWAGRRGPDIVGGELWVGRPAVGRARARQLGFPAPA